MFQLLEFVGTGCPHPATGSAQVIGDDISVRFYVADALVPGAADGPDQNLNDIAAAVYGCVDPPVLSPSRVNSSSSFSRD